MDASLMSDAAVAPEVGPGRRGFLLRVSAGAVVFRRLDTEQLTTITDLLLEETRRRLAGQGT